MFNSLPGMIIVLTNFLAIEIRTIRCESISCGRSEYISCAYSE